MSPLVCLFTVIFLCSLHSSSTAQSTDQSTLPMSSTTGLSTSRAFTRSSENASATSDQTAAGVTGSAAPANATVPLNGSSTAQSETPPVGGGRTAPSAGATSTSEAGKTSTTELVSSTTELRPTTTPRRPDATQLSAAPSGPTAAPSREPAVPTPALTGTAPSTARATEHASQEPSAIPGQNNSVTEKKRQPGKTLGVFISLAVVLLLVLGLVYLIYSKTKKDDPFSHQRLHESEPVLSLDVSVEPADRFYGGLSPDLGGWVRGDHVMSQRALNQAAGVGGNPASQPQPGNEIQLKPMSESSVNIFL